MAIPAILRRKIYRYPFLLGALLRLKPHLYRLAVKRTTNLVIEGFPRSGNTFAVVAFESVQPLPLVIAHHLHAPAQIVYAARHNIPALVLIRKPVDAIVSYLQRDGSISVAGALAEYIQFYNVVQNNLSHVFLAKFEDVIKDYGKVIRELNERFLTNFAQFEHTSENQDAVFQKIEEYSRQTKTGESGVARPSAIRQSKKSDLIEEVMSQRYVYARQKAESLYEKLLSHQESATL